MDLQDIYANSSYQPTHIIGKTNQSMRENKYAATMKGQV